MEAVIFQVLRIHDEYTEHRINAAVLHDSKKCFGDDAVTVSIPLNCDIQISVVGKEKQGICISMLKFEKKHIVPHHFYFVSG